MSDAVRAQNAKKKAASAFVTLKRSNMPTIRLGPRTPQSCDLCGDVKELRPYGPKGEWVCFDCGMKNKEAATRAFLKRLDEGDTRLGDTPDPPLM